MPRSMKVGSAAKFGESVDLARDFIACWTNDGQPEECEEFARQLRDELDVALNASWERSE